VLALALYDQPKAVVLYLLNTVRPGRDFARARPDIAAIRLPARLIVTSDQNGEAAFLKTVVENIERLVHSGTKVAELSLWGRLNGRVRLLRPARQRLI